MSAVATAPPPCEDRASVRRERPVWARPAGVTLGQLLARAHEAVHAGASTTCPACGGELAARGLESRCVDCGSRLV